MCQVRVKSVTTSCRGRKGRTPKYIGLMLVHFIIKNTVNQQYENSKATKYVREQVNRERGKGEREERIREIGR